MAYPCGEVRALGHVWIEIDGVPTPFSHASFPHFYPGDRYDPDRVERELDAIEEALRAIREKDHDVPR